MFSFFLPTAAERARALPSETRPRDVAQQKPPGKGGEANPPATQTLVVSVVDENGVAVRGARVSLTWATTGAEAKRETDYAGRCEFAGLAPGSYRVRIEKEGFYAVNAAVPHAAEARVIEVTLPHQQEYRESVTVTASSPSIDPARTAATQTLNSQEITNIPYTTTRDIRNALPLLPGVLQDATGQVHLNGSASSQIFTRLDGFHISQPFTGLFDLRVSTDAVRAIEAQGSRISAELGKGSGGLLSLETGMGDDHYRISATAFIPSLQSRKGIHIETFTPRLTLSGPLRRGKAWFYDAGDGEYDLRIIKELPEGADQTSAWRWSNLAKVQANLAPGNSLTFSFLANGLRLQHAGLGPFSPLETTTEVRQSAYLAAVKDQVHLGGGMLLEAGFAFSHYATRQVPRGDAPFVIRPEAVSGNFFKTSDDMARRWQGLLNLYVPARQWHGHHLLQFGVDVDGIATQRLVRRGEIRILREDGTLTRQAAFSNPPRVGKGNLEFSGYAQDRWSVNDRWLVEAGARFDWDEIVDRAFVSPRLASTYLLTRDGETKLSLGVGLVYDETNLVFLRRPLEGMRTDVFFATDGVTPLGPPVIAMFVANPAALTAPRFLNWSAEVERKLAPGAYFKVDYIRKRGRNGFGYENEGAGPSGWPSGLFVLRNNRRDRYDGVSLTVRYTFRKTYRLFGSYARSSARSNAVLDSNLDNPLFSPQAAGPLPWDAPNRLLSWGWLPLAKKFDLAYTLEWRTGFRFSVVDENLQLAEPPNARRFPDFFSLNLHVERRFRLFGFEWALRGGFNNLTGHANPAFVNNNKDSPRFLTFAGNQGRAFTGRIRFLGRK